MASSNLSEIENKINEVRDRLASLTMSLDPDSVTTGRPPVANGVLNQSDPPTLIERSINESFEKTKPPGGFGKLVELAKREAAHRQQSEPLHQMPSQPQSEPLHEEEFLSPQNSSQQIRPSQRKEQEKLPLPPQQQQQQQQQQKQQQQYDHMSLYPRHTAYQFYQEQPQQQQRPHMYSVEVQKKGLNTSLSLSEPDALRTQPPAQGAHVYFDATPVHPTRAPRVWPTAISNRDLAEPSVPFPTPCERPALRATGVPCAPTPAQNPPPLPNRAAPLESAFDPLKAVQARLREKMMRQAPPRTSLPSSASCSPDPFPKSPSPRPCAKTRRPPTPGRADSARPPNATASTSRRHSVGRAEGAVPSRRSSPARSAVASSPLPRRTTAERTVLDVLSGAELFALMRLRGLIVSRGESGESSLPDTRCHSIYVSQDEHRQLLELRASLKPRRAPPASATSRTEEMEQRQKPGTAVPRRRPPSTSRRTAQR